MFSNSKPFFASLFETPKSQSQKDQELRPYIDDKQLISTLPSNLGWGIPIRRYHNFWFPEPVLPGILSLQQNYNPSSPQKNVFLVTYPKSGTTWLKALVFVITNRNNINNNNADHPLLSRHPQDCSPYLEGIFSTPVVPNLDALPPPQILGTHIPFSLLPESIKKSRIVYLCREPKDTLVSMWHFVNKMKPEGVEAKSFEDMFNLFCDGAAAYGPVWDHQLEYWRESVRQPDNVLFLKYEEMKENPGESVRRLAEFLGQAVTAEEERGGVVEEVVRLCSIGNLKGLDVNKEGVRGREINMTMNNSSFFRKGIVGDWREHLTPEMAERMDRISQEKFRGSGLSFREN